MNTPRQKVEQIIGWAKTAKVHDTEAENGWSYVLDGEKCDRMALDILRALEIPCGAPQEDGGVCTLLSHDEAEHPHGHPFNGGNESGNDRRPKPKFPDPAGSERTSGPMA